MGNSLSINKNKNNLKVLSYHTNHIYHLYKLKDGRLASCSNDSSLNIYKKETFELQLSIKEHSKGINSFTQLKDERIITCSWDTTLKIIKLIGEINYKIVQTLNGHTNTIMKVIEIKDNELISISGDKEMKIWILNKENIFECITNIIFQDEISTSNIFKINQKEFVTYSFIEENLKFWNSNNYSIITFIKNIESFWIFQTMCLLNNDILCVGGDNSKGFYLIQISTHHLIKIIFGPKRIFSINKCLDGLILCSIIDKNGNNSIVKYKFEGNNLKKVFEKEKAHDNYIYSCIEIEKGIIASGSRDCLIKLWNF